MAWAPAYVCFNAAGGMSTSGTPPVVVADVLGDTLVVVVVVAEVLGLADVATDVLVAGGVASSLHPAKATNEPAATTPIKLLRNNNDPFPSSDAAPTRALD